MKKLTTTIFTVLFAVIAFNSSQAQFVKAGAGLMYGSEIERIGIRVDGVYQINEEFRAVVDLGIFIPETEDLGGGNEVTFTWWELNANANYIFVADEEEGFTAYALGGLNFTSLKWSYSGDNEAMFNDDSETEVGLNIGIGGEYDIDFADLFGELKFVLGDADQLNIGIGLRIPIGGN
ncbi:MAG: hypothetical protein WD059_16040 [Balneolaceae bacterium]